MEEVCQIGILGGLSHHIVIILLGPAVDIMGSHSHRSKHNIVNKYISNDN